jgi:hypothetical protein
MSNIENLVQLLRNMNNEIADLNKQTQIKNQRILEITNRIEELNSTLIQEKTELDSLYLRKEKVTDLQSVAESNFKQINESVNTLLDILKTG